MIRIGWCYLLIQNGQDGIFSVCICVYKYLLQSTGKSKLSIIQTFYCDIFLFDFILCESIQYDIVTFLFLKIYQIEISEFTKPLLKRATASLVSAPHALYSKKELFNNVNN